MSPPRCSGTSDKMELDNCCGLGNAVPSPPDEATGAGSIETVRDSDRRSLKSCIFLETGFRAVFADLNQSVPQTISRHSVTRRGSMRIIFRAKAMANPIVNPRIKNQGERYRTAPRLRARLLRPSRLSPMRAWGWTTVQVSVLVGESETRRYKSGSDLGRIEMSWLDHAQVEARIV